MSVVTQQDRVWRACIECGFRSQFAFYTPSSVYCEGCDTKVGETDRAVEADLVALKGDTIVDTKTDETLATVEWHDDQLEIHEGDPDGQS